MDILFEDFRLLTLCENGAPYGLVDDSVIHVRDGSIAWIGPRRELSDSLANARTVSGQRRFLSPGLIDCHTHLVFGGSRADEWEMRLNGVPYETIARQGGGILSTVRATRAATESELYSAAEKRLNALIRQGVTAFEIKTGYGLDLENELKMLRVINQLAEAYPIHISRTLLAAHAVPAEHKGRSDDYLDVVCEQIIPATANDCDAVDVFCESIAFDLKQTRRVFDSARAVRPSMDLKIHAEQLSRRGGAKLAAEMNAISADHLEYLSESDCEVLGRFGTVATLLPGAFYNLKEKQIPPIQALRNAQVPMAIATDANPGSSPVSSILLMAHMACNLFGLTPEESIRGLTVNAAKALRLGTTMGTLEPGKKADFAVWDIQSPAELAYGIAHNPCMEVYVDGQVIHSVNR